MDRTEYLNRSTHHKQPGTRAVRGARPNNSDINNVIKMECNSGKGITGVVTLNQYDVICGRGALALKHPGNVAHRTFVRESKVIYATCPKQEKLRISKRIVASIRGLNGRFLVREDGKDSSFVDERDVNGNPVTWRDIGDKKAIEKTSQALREGQPYLLEKMAEEQKSGNRAPNGVVNVVHQSQTMHRSQFSPVQTLEQNIVSQLHLQADAQAQMFGLEPPVQNARLPEQHQGKYNAGPRSQSPDMWQKLWGSQNPPHNSPPYFRPAMERIYERNGDGTSNSGTSNSSQVEEGPAPLPYHLGADTNICEHISIDDCQQLIMALSFDGECESEDRLDGSQDESQDGSKNRLKDGSPDESNERSHNRSQDITGLTGNKSFDWYFI